jgi:hypothetical protein
MKEDVTFPQGTCHARRFARSDDLAFPVAMAIWTQWKSTTPSEPAGGLSRLSSDPPTPEAEWPPAMRCGTATGSRRALRRKPMRRKINKSPALRAGLCVSMFVRVRTCSSERRGRHQPWSWKSLATKKGLLVLLVTFPKS